MQVLINPKRVKLQQTTDEYSFEIFKVIAENGDHLATIRPVYGPMGLESYDLKDELTGLTHSAKFSSSEVSELILELLLNHIGLTLKP